MSGLCIGDLPGALGNQPEWFNTDPPRAIVSRETPMTQIAGILYASKLWHLATVLILLDYVFCHSG
jgi:hypothetical protein